ncbi:hypothetical protein F5B22DRAFT_31399 [Xylaria bambusicola]|uniref:uncharacterized protein n=1 Tax=Xylaria bambusicola TaxID=326684 RepID=UPI002008294D|nr:uncharacterized protein F5B22DRAFT_31399 [Xylaria bambusicola]KAI0528329.1 hypothetical protein F5B22DRAFT_31399 [Xylaria bambusicola]
MKNNEFIADYIDRITEVLAQAFQDDPLYAWLFHHLPLAEHEDLLPKLFRGYFKQSSLNNSMFLEVDGFGCCGVLMPPGANIKNPRTLLRAGLVPGLFTIGPRTFKRAFFDYGSGVEPMLHKAFTKEEQKSHWYVFMMGTAVGRRRQGLASAMLRDIIDRAGRDKRPVWLEATTRDSLRLYTRHGFQTIGEVVLGKGVVDAAGLPRKGGPGVTIWCMCWRL